MKNKGWDPIAKEYVTISGEKSIGTSAPPHPVTPRLYGMEADTFKDMWGICKGEGCARLASDCKDHG